MKFSKEEQKIVKAIVQCENQGGNIALALNYSQLLEKQGVGIVCTNNENLVFLRKDLYSDCFSNNGRGYVNTFLNLIEKLEKNNHLICERTTYSQPLVIGATSSEWVKIGVIAVNGDEALILEGPYTGWYGADRQEKYWMYNDWSKQLSSISRFLYSNYCVSEELKELVKNNFKTDEEIRFAKQQFATWLSIGVAILLGILGIIF